MHLSTCTDTLVLTFVRCGELCFGCVQNGRAGARRSHGAPQAARAEAHTARAFFGCGGHPTLFVSPRKHRTHRANPAESPFTALHTAPGSGACDSGGALELDTSSPCPFSAYINFKPAHRSIASGKWGVGGGWSGKGREVLILRHRIMIPS